MRPNRKEPVSAFFWFQSLKFARMAASYSGFLSNASRWSARRWLSASMVRVGLAMGLLSLPLLVGSTRAISASQRIMMGAIIGIVFYLLQQVTGHLAGLFSLVPSITILTPVFLLLAVAVMAQYWRGFRKTGTQLPDQTDSAEILK